MNLQELEAIVLQGESYKIEFKESIDKTFVEEVTALANASGGIIFLGVSDDGRLKGADVSNPSRSRVQDTISQIKPAITVDIEVVDNIMVIHVPEGRNKPYACSKGFFLRMGANSQKLDRDGIIEFFQSEGRVRFDELVQRNINFNEAFNKNAYEKFLELAKISDVIDPENVLLNMDCGIKEDKFIFNNAGVLFFSHEPMKYIKHASVVCALYKGIDKVTVLDRKDLSGNLIEIIEDGILFLKKHLSYD